MRVYTKQYTGILSAVFGAKAAFANAFAPIQTKDGISNNATAFEVKTTATPVVVGNYNKGENVGFGTGTGSTSRFGNRTEVIYSDVPANYTYDLAIHEGLDRHTVNNDLDAAVAERLAKQSEAQVRKMNANNGAFLSANAATANTQDIADYSDATVKGLFNTMAKLFVNNEVTADKSAYLAPDLYNAVVDLAQTTTAKGSTISLDTNGLPMYKGFSLFETPDQYFVEGEVAYFTANQVAVPFVGIQTARTIESEDFDGVALQAAVKGGSFILNENKVAVAKVTFTPAG
jgi:hypothetical protein